MTGALPLTNGLPPSHLGIVRKHPLLSVWRRSCKGGFLFADIILFLDDAESPSVLPIPQTPSDLRSSSFAPRHSVQAPSALGLASVL